MERQPYTGTPNNSPRRPLVKAVSTLSIPDYFRTTTPANSPAYCTIYIISKLTFFIANLYKYSPTKKKRESSDTNFVSSPIEDINFVPSALDVYIEKSQNDIKTGNLSPSASAPTSPLTRAESTPILIPKTTER